MNRGSERIRSPVPRMSRWSIRGSEHSASPPADECSADTRQVLSCASCGARLQAAQAHAHLVRNCADRHLCTTNVHPMLSLTHGARCGGTGLPVQVVEVVVRMLCKNNTT